MEVGETYLSLVPSKKKAPSSHRFKILVMLEQIYS